MRSLSVSTQLLNCLRTSTRAFWAFEVVNRVWAVVNNISTQLDAAVAVISQLSLKLVLIQEPAEDLL